jgi:hypothetical protein
MTTKLTPEQIHTLNCRFDAYRIEALGRGLLPIAVVLHDPGGNSIGISAFGLNKEELAVVFSDLSYSLNNKQPTKNEETIFINKRFSPDENAPEP